LGPTNPDHPLGRSNKGNAEKKGLTTATQTSVTKGRTMTARSNEMARKTGARQGAEKTVARGGKTGRELNKKKKHKRGASLLT